MAASTVDPADEKLAWAVGEALRRSEPIRAVDLGSLRVEVHGGIVVLRGVVASETHRFAAVRLARAVSGVKDVVNELLTDGELERRIAVALASSEETSKRRIVVNVVGGVARLYGAVPAEADAEAATGIALAVPGVVEVESRLQVVPPGAPVVLAWQQSVEGRPRKKSDEP